jgi:uncharacterized protein YjbI with pentapeptide repeats
MTIITEAEGTTVALVNRWTGEALFRSSQTNIGDATVEAIKQGANLRGAYLQDADLQDADLQDADLQDADLRVANLQGANLQGANLQGANLRGANLRDANLTPIRDDFWAVLSAVPCEVLALRAALATGRVDGSTYSGDCACLVGTIANARGCDYSDLGALKANAARPAERFFLAINRGDTPATNQASKLAVEWLDEWVANVRAAFGGVA